MAQIKIYSDTTKGCIFFEGSTVDPKFIGTIVAVAHPTLSNRVVIKRTDKLLSDGITFRTIFRKMRIDRIQNRDGQDLVAELGMTRDEIVVYLNGQFNDFTRGSGGTVLTLDDAPNFSLDDQGTTILIDNGDARATNSIKAVLESDGTISIKSHGDTGVVYYSNIDPSTPQIDGNAIAGGPQDVVNTLNELFTAGPFEAVVISDPENTVIADVQGVNAGYTLEGAGVSNPITDDIAAGASTHNNNAGVLSTATINQAGEYFTFDMRVRGQIGFGLVVANDNWQDFVVGSQTYGDPSTFCNGVNSAHYGFQFSHYFHPTPNGPWTNYGASTSYVGGPGWTTTQGRFSNNEESTDWANGDPVKMKVGIDTNGFIEIAYYDNSESAWVMCSRSAYTAPAGAEYKLGIKLPNSLVRVYSAPKVHLRAEDNTPTTIGDTTIDAFGGVTGNLADGVIVATASGHNDGVITSQTISASGEYFEFSANADEAHNVGLFYTEDYSTATVTADTADWAEGKYMFFGGKINTNEQYNSGVYKNGSGSGIPSVTLNRPTASIKYRVGFDTQGRATLWSSTDGTTFVESQRMSSAAPSGDYKFIWVGDSSGATLSSVSTGVLTSAPVMTFRYIESPDDTYQWPLFATEEEANYYDANHTIGSAGSGTSHTHVYVDDPTNTTWYMPDTGSTMTDTSDPVGVTFAGQSVVWTEITSLTNADLVPPSFTGIDLSVDELSSVNYQTQPADTLYTTTVSGLPSGLSLSTGGLIVGTAPEVTGDNVANPTDSYPITVTRTNSYGSSTGSFNIVVNNLTAPTITPIAGVTHEGGTDLVDSDTMGDGSVISIDDVIENGNRIVVNKEWIDNVVLPAITSGSGSKSVWVGFAAEGVTPNYSSITNADFRLAYEFNCDDASRAANNWRLKTHIQGTSLANTGIGSLTNGLYDYVFINDGANVRAGALIESQGHNASTRVFDANDGVWQRTLYNSTTSTGSKDIIIATVNTTLDIDLSEFNEYVEPTASTILTSWTKALDFSGSNEYAVNSNAAQSCNPTRLASAVTHHTLPASGQTVSYGRPWATAIVFSSDRHNSNQHIWNQGEGSGSSDDNIYVRQSATGNLYFGWGRDGELNECHIGGALTQGKWYGLYIAHNGARLTFNSSTPSNLADVFDIYLFREDGGVWSVSTSGVADSQGQRSLSTNWGGSYGTNGGYMGRSVDGYFSIGGRRSNRSFHGKVASMVRTTLLNNVSMPDLTEIGLMITDPLTWKNNYKAGSQFRQPQSDSGSSTWDNANASTKGRATQIWLMGDGGNDSYSNMIRNRINSSDQNDNKLNLISMVSNDIQTVYINGLS